MPNIFATIQKYTETPHGRMSVYSAGATITLMQSLIYYYLVAAKLATRVQGAKFSKLKIRKIRNKPVWLNNHTNYRLDFSPKSKRLDIQNAHELIHYTTYQSQGLYTLSINACVVTPTILEVHFLQ